MADGDAEPDPCDVVALQQERNKRIAGGAFHPVEPSLRRFEGGAHYSVWETTTATHTQRRSAASEEYVTVCISPFAGRRPTILFKPLDRPCDGDLRGQDKHVYVEPSPLPRLPSHMGEMGNAINGNVSPCKRTSVVPRTAEYATLRFTMPAPAVRFSAVMCTLERAGFVEETSLLSKAWLLKWCKRPVPSDFAKLKAFQRINHFPGTWRLGKKDELHRHLVAMALKWKSSREGCSESPKGCGAGGEVGNEDYMDFFPEAWVLPDEEAELDRVLCAPEERGNIFIAKPTTAACGRGIQLLVAGQHTRNELRHCATRAHNSSHSTRGGRGGGNADGAARGSGAVLRRSSHRMIVQRYVSDPLLVEGYKFDLRLYVVVTSYAPLRAYLYREGLVRFATSPYPTGTGDTCAGVSAGDDVLTAHLTNFTINKKSEDFLSPGGGDDDGDPTGTAASKWTLSALERHFNEHGLDWDGTMRRIRDILVKVFLSVEPYVKEEMNSIGDSGNGSRVKGCCFEVYGVDVLLRRPLPAEVIPSPVLMEVNIMPSLSTHYSTLDQCVKGNFIADMLTLVGLTAGPPHTGVSGARSKGSGEDNAHCRISYGHAFIDSLTDAVEREACLRAEEELLRCRNFVRLCPTLESYKRYRALFGKTVSAESGVRSLNEVLSAWEAARLDSPPSWVC